MNTLFAGQTSIHLSTVDSTNSYASELLRHKQPLEGTLIYTFQQEKGRGQMGNTWESVPNKNVALSLILYPGFLRPERQFMLSKISSLAVADLMAELLGKDLTVRIKWPNDVYVSGHKIAGILIENSLRDSGIQHSVIGIGININQLEFSSPNASSLALLAGHEFDLKSCLERLCELIEARYLQLKAGKDELIDRAYLERLYRLHEKATFQSGPDRFDGEITGLSSEGKLMVLLANGEEKAFGIKEIAFL